MGETSLTGGWDCQRGLDRQAPERLAAVDELSLSNPVNVLRKKQEISKNVLKNKFYQNFEFQFFSSN